MAYPPGIDDFKAQFTRDFVYGGVNGGFETVLDSDIQRALNETPIVFNQTLWGSNEVTIAFLYAAAHFMVLNIQEAGGLAVKNKGLGVQSKGGGTVASKSVGGVSVNYDVPDFVKQSPILSQFMRTDYGQKYIQLITPRLVANMAVLSGSEPVNFAGNVSPLIITTLDLPGGIHG